MTSERPTKFIREPLDGRVVGAKLRCFNPGRNHPGLVENDVYTIAWIDWPFCVEFEELPGKVYTLDRFKLYTGEVVR